MGMWSFRGATSAVSVMAMAATLAGCDIRIGAARFSAREEKKFTVTGSPQVELTTFDGSIEVRGWDKPEVLVEVEKRGDNQAAVDKIQVKTTQTGNTITVDIPKVASATHFTFGQSPSASLVVTVPTQSVLKLDSGDGSVTIKRVNGKINIRTGDGSVRITESKGDLFVRTGDGSIQAAEIDGHVDVETRDGSISIEGTLRGVRADSGDGSIKLTARKGSTMDADWVATTNDGSIDMRVSDGFGAEVDAESGDGRVRIDNLAGQSDRRAQGESHDRSSARGRIGDGGKLLKLRTGAGSISLKNW
ncbi:MAG: DUF4097 family beta strand repeat-containing protein [Acidobacteria bacterium]|nr:DUF4097 family beta strand repeat-containing protein [Acidobacteriota bacterium]